MSPGCAAVDCTECTEYSDKRVFIYCASNNLQESAVCILNQTGPERAAVDRTVCTQHSHKLVYIYYTPNTL